MSGNVENIRISAAWLSYKGTNLGYTQGGIGISIENIVREVMVDAEGPLPQAVFSLGKRIQITVTLAESDYDRLTSLLGGSSRKINHSYGTDLLSSAGDLVITSLHDAADYVTIKDAIVTGQVATNFSPNRERNWSITFTAYGESNMIMEFSNIS